MKTKTSIDRTRDESPILAEMENKGEIEIVETMYNVSDEQVEFFEG